jgi:hypothetical protein
MFFCYPGGRALVMKPLRAGILVVEPQRAGVLVMKSHPAGILVMKPQRAGILVMNPLCASIIVIEFNIMIPSQSIPRIHDAPINICWYSWMFSLFLCSWLCRQWCECIQHCPGLSCEHYNMRFKPFAPCQTLATGLIMKSIGACIPVNCLE